MFHREVDGSKLWVGLLAKNLFNKIKSDRKLKYWHIKANIIFITSDMATPQNLQCYDHWVDCLNLSISLKFQRKKVLFEYETKATGE